MVWPNGNEDGDIDEKDAGDLEEKRSFIATDVE